MLNNRTKVSLKRYTENDLISTKLDVLSETMNYLSFFKSLDFTEEILLNSHSIRNTRERKTLAKLIKEHVSLSLDLANQAFNSKEELSYLPLYYSCLNLIKAHLLFMNKRRELNRNLRHGMSYNENQINRDFLNEELFFYKRGAIPYYYQLISGKTITNNEKIKVKINDIYSKIKDISAEYVLVSGLKPQIIELKGKIEISGIERYIKLENHSSYQKPLPATRKIKAISGFKKIDDNHYLSRVSISNQEELQTYIENNFNKFYINHFYCKHCNDFHIYTVESAKKHVFNEEISVALGYFHLSNIIRYNPMHYRKLVDSKYNPLLIALRKSGYFTFIKSMIGHFHRKTFDVNI